jgi:nucleotide-binding universal stress UspA family protein
MRTVLAALDDTAVAEPVAAFAALLSNVMNAEVDAVHVHVDGEDLPRAAAERIGVALRTVEGAPGAALEHEAAPDDVVAVVLGRSRDPGGGSAGPIALELVTALPKPVAVVPRDAQRGRGLARVLVPLEGTLSTTLAPRRTIQLAADAGLEVVLLHVFDPASVPLFSDQPQHERAAWVDEFLARYAPYPPETVLLETRVGEPEQHVVAVALEWGADLIALGWSQELAEGRAPIVRAVLEQARLPVLLIPVATVAAEAETEHHHVHLTT